MRVVILRGAGRVFSAGGDIKNLQHALLNNTSVPAFLLATDVLCVAQLRALDAEGLGLNACSVLPQCLPPAQQTAGVITKMRAIPQPIIVAAHGQLELSLHVAG